MRGNHIRREMRSFVTFVCRMSNVIMEGVWGVWYLINCIRDIYDSKAALLE